MKTTTLPVQLQLGRVLIAGDGELAQSKYWLLKEMQADVVWWRSMPDEPMLAEESVRQDKAETRFSLVIIADFGLFGTTVESWARAHRLLCNMVDRPEKSDVYIPAIVTRGSVRIGIGTSGINPVLARVVRASIERALPHGLERISNFTRKWRERVINALPDLNMRRIFWEKMLFGTFAEQVASGYTSASELDAMFACALHKAELQEPGYGEVTLVGAGPGDASLLTLKGLRALQRADVVLYDSLVSPGIIKLARRDAVLEDVGKRRKRCPIPQGEICARLVTLAQQGKHVCRLKGGDPYLFARGGEEAQALANAGIAFEVIPGVTSASAIAAATGIPLTHRGYARTVRFLTGHLALGQDTTTWQALANRQETLVVYMGFMHLLDIAEQLIACGVPAELPVACIQNGTLPGQRIVVATLGQAAYVQHQFKLKEGPILLVIGEVVQLRSSVMTQSGSASTYCTTESNNQEQE